MAAVFITIPLNIFGNKIRLCALAVMTLKVKVLCDSKLREMTISMAVLV